MILSSKGLDFIKRHEGFKSHVYLDSGGVPTIGYGHQIKPGENFDKGITKREAEALLAQDVQGAVHSANKNVTAPLSQNQFDALVSLAYNLRNFAQTSLLAKINAGEVVTEADFTKYNRVGGKVIPGLTVRRRDEFNLFSRGDYRERS